MPSLTNHLVQLNTTPSYASATHHPFLSQAGEGTLPDERLALWLSQDRIYAAHAYPRFIGSLISRIPFHPTDPINGPRESHNRAILVTLVKCLDNVVKEVNFFGDTAAEWKLDMDGWVERKGTRDYTAEMARVTQGDTGLEDGLIFLWAMEKVYFDAWGYVKDLISHRPGPPTPAAAVHSFANNWSSPEFAVFVEELAQIVDGLGIEPGSKQWHRAEKIWQRVVELEVGFWPEDGEENRMKETKTQWVQGFEVLADRAAVSKVCASG